LTSLEFVSSLSLQQVLGVSKSVLSTYHFPLILGKLCVGLGLDFRRGMSC